MLRFDRTATREGLTRLFNDVKTRADEVVDDNQGILNTSQRLTKRIQTVKKLHQKISASVSEELGVGLGDNNGYGFLYDRQDYETIIAQITRTSNKDLFLDFSRMLSQQLMLFTDFFLLMTQLEYHQEPQSRNSANTSSGFIEVGREDELHQQFKFQLPAGIAYRIGLTKKEISTGRIDYFMTRPELSLGNLSLKACSVRAQPRDYEELTYRPPCKHPMFFNNDNPGGFLIGSDIAQISLSDYRHSHKENTINLELGLCPQDSSNALKLNLYSALQEGGGSPRTTTPIFESYDPKQVTNESDKTLYNLSCDLGLLDATSFFNPTQ